MKVKCPVAGCDYTVKGADDGFKHWQNYDDFHKTLHMNWINFFYPDIAKSDMPDTVKFREAYRKWKKDQKIRATQKAKPQPTEEEHIIPEGMGKLLK